MYNEALVCLVGFEISDTIPVFEITNTISYSKLLSYNILRYIKTIFQPLCLVNDHVICSSLYDNMIKLDNFSVNHPQDLTKIAMYRIVKILGKRHAWDTELRDLINSLPLPISINLDLCTLCSSNIQPIFNSHMLRNMIRESHEYLYELSSIIVKYVKCPRLETGFPAYFHNISRKISTIWNINVDNYIRKDYILSPIISIKGFANPKSYIRCEITFDLFIRYIYVCAIVFLRHSVKHHSILFSKIDKNNDIYNLLTSYRLKYLFNHFNDVETCELLKRNFNHYEDIPDILSFFESFERRIIYRSSIWWERGLIFISELICNVSRCLKNRYYRDVTWCQKVCKDLFPSDIHDSMFNTYSTIRTHFIDQIVKGYIKLQH